MKISEVAAAAGTTPRAVRHYHRLGLLPEPNRLENGYRSYGIAELARLMRIRWLADNGLPLGSVATVLAEEQDRPAADDLRADLTALHDDLAQTIARLTRKKERLGRMLAATEQGRVPTALPAEVCDAFDRARAEADRAERVALDRERDLLEVMAISGTAPDAMFTWFSGALADREARTGYRRILRGWEHVEGRPVAGCRAEIDRLAEDLATLLRRSGVETVLAAVPEVPDDGGVLSEESLLPDPAQRAVVRRAFELLTAEPES